jgi:hypothetical protein
MFGRYVSFILCGIVEHMHDEEAQKAVFVMLRHFVGEEAAKGCVCGDALLPGH